jgi:hypothetical protein
MVKSLCKDILRLLVKVFYKKSAYRDLLTECADPGLKYDNTPPLRIIAMVVENHFVLFPVYLEL